MLPDIRLDYSANAPEWQKYLDDFDVNKPLPALPTPKSDKEKYFLSTRGLSAQFFNIKALEERLTKYTIFAPFGGVVTSAGVDPGTMVVAGQKLGEFSNPSTYELEASVSISDLEYIKTNQQVSLKSDNLNQTWQGIIRRISDKIDPNTQTVRVFVAVSGKELREGMYLYGEILAGTFEDAFEIPRKLVEDNAVYLVTDNMLKRKPITVLRITEKVAIVKGLTNGDLLLNENITGAFEGMKVKTASARKDS
jgi:RND family efflux transporter MFP subunit